MNRYARWVVLGMVTLTTAPSVVRSQPATRFRAASYQEEATRQTHVGRGRFRPAPVTLPPPEAPPAPTTPEGKTPASNSGLAGLFGPPVASGPAPVPPSHRPGGALSPSEAWKRGLLRNHGDDSSSLARTPPCHAWYRGRGVLQIFRPKECVGFPGERVHPIGIGTFPEPPLVPVHPIGIGTLPEPPLVPVPTFEDLAGPAGEGTGEVDEEVVDPIDGEPLGGGLFGL